jgi:hypothetical protein
MKKLTLPLAAFIVGMTMLALSSCSKSEVSKNPDPIITPPPPPVAAPVLTLTKNFDSILHNKKVTIGWTSDKPLTVEGTTGTSGEFSAGPFDSTQTIQVVGYYGDGKSVSKPFALWVWHKDNSDLQERDKMKNVFFKSCISGTENSPNVVWFDGPPFPAGFWLKFSANGTATSYSDVVGNSSGYWVWGNLDHSVLIMQGEEPAPWSSKITPNGWERGRHYNGFYTLQKFEKF